jgi:hypothetical protein
MDVTVSEDLIKIGPPGRKLFATVEQAEQLIVKLEAAVKTASPTASTPRSHGRTRSGIRSAVLVRSSRSSPGRA